MKIAAIIIVIASIFLNMKNDKNNPTPIPVVSEVSNVSITPLMPVSGVTKWKRNSNQTVSWSIDGLPSASFMSIISLKASNDPEALDGIVISEPLKVGVNKATYRVGVARVGGDALVGLETGKYDVIFSIFRTPDSSMPMAAYGDLVVSKKGGQVEIVD